MDENFQSKAVEDMTNDELRAEAGRILGHPLWKHEQLTKSALNSMYAFATGEFSIHPGDVYREGSATRDDLLYDVVSVLGIEYDPGDGQHAKPFRKSELQAVVRYLRGNDDQRHWAKPGASPA